MIVWTRVRERSRFRPNNTISENLEIRNPYSSISPSKFSGSSISPSKFSVAESSSNAAFSGNCDVDVNECASKPCANKATCTESSTQSAVSVGAYRCTCKAGYANGMCGYGGIAAYATQCSVRESVQNITLSGNCDVDVDECASKPCANGAVCKDSTSDKTISAHAFQCTCKAGFANGKCGYTSTVGHYVHECQVMESTANASQTGICDVDVNECLSSPCINNATCADSSTNTAVAAHAYTCACVAGFANGMCAYTFAPAYAAQCSLTSAAGGNCDVNVDECASKPCQNGGVCHQYVDAWKCDCFEVVNNRTGIRKAYNGTYCETEINVCSNSEDDCDPLYALCHHTGPGQHECKCHIGWTGDGKTCRDIDECASKPCKNGAKCTQSSCSPSSFPTGTKCDPKSKGLPPVDAYSCACVAGFANGVCAAGWDKKSAAFTKQYAKEILVVSRC